MLPQEHWQVNSTIKRMKTGQGDRLYLFHPARFSVYVSTVGRFGLILHVKYIKSQTLVYNLLKRVNQ